MIMESRIAEKAMELSEGKIKEVANWLKSLGCEINYIDEGEAHIKSPTGMIVGLMQTDPSTCSVSIAFCIAGIYWPFAFPNLDKRIKKLWKVKK